MNTNRANHLVSARNAFRAVLTAITVAAAVLLSIALPSGRTAALVLGRA